MGIPPCPPPTLPNEPPECEQRRQQLQATNPHLEFDDNIQWFIFNTQSTLEEATNSCAGFGTVTIEELAVINLIVNNQPLCPMLVWATLNGNPTLAFVVPSANPAVIEIF